MSQPVSCGCGGDTFQTRVSPDLIEIKCDLCGEEFHITPLVRGHLIPNEWKTPARKNVIKAASTQYR